MGWVDEDLYKNPVFSSLDVTEGYGNYHKSSDFVKATNKTSRFSQSRLTEWGLGCGWSAAPTNHTPKCLFSAACGGSQAEVFTKAATS
jgi:hypothetical protein